MGFISSTPQIAPVSKLETLIQELHENVDYEKWRSCQAKTQGAHDCPSCCGEQYYNSLNISYQCEQKRNIYALRYLPSHIYENYSGALLIPENDRNRIFSKDVVKVLSLGGGPGSDIAGFKKFIDSLDEQECPCQDFKIRRLDIEDGWNDISLKVIYLHGKKEKGFEHKRFTMDICKSTDWFNGREFDLVLVSYLLSELQDNQMEALSNNLKKCLSNDALFIINDRDESAVNHRILGLTSMMGLQLKKSKVLDGWAYFSYPNEIAALAKPKFNISSKVQVFGR